MEIVSSKNSMEIPEFNRLVALLKAKDENAWKRLYFVLKRYIVYWLEMKGLSKTDSESLFHDSFTLLYERFPQCEFENFQKLRAFASSIANHKLKEYYRQSKKQQQHQSIDHENAAIELEDDSLQSDLYQIELKKVIQEMSQSLSDREREILHKYYLDGKRLKDVAKELGISEENGWVLKHRALKKARKIVRGLLK